MRSQCDGETSSNAKDTKEHKNKRNPQQNLDTPQSQVTLIVSDSSVVGNLEVLSHLVN